MGRSDRWDLHLEVIVNTTIYLTAEQEELIRRFAEISKTEESSPLKKVKKAARKITKAMGLD